LRPRSFSGTVALLAALAFSALPSRAGAVLPNLGSAASFGLLGGTISNTGVSLVVGNVGSTTATTGFPPGLATGNVYAAGDPAAIAAYNDFITAYNQALSEPVTQPLVSGLTTNQSFVGNNVYAFTPTDVTSVANETLTFDAQGNSGEIFILRTNGSLTVNGPLNFNLINGALASNIYWIIGGSATIDPGATPEVWDGDIFAGISFTMSAGVGGSGILAGTVNGCVFAETANTLAGTTDVNGCGATSTPEPNSFLLLATGCLLAAFRKQRMKVTDAVLPRRRPVTAYGRLSSLCPCPATRADSVHTPDKTGLVARSGR